jgi:hypothetical protein
MSDFITKLLEHLAEMFPKQDYQTKLDRYLASKNIKDTCDLDNWITRYHREEERNQSWI